jgi:hypothetical protein
VLNYTRQGASGVTVTAAVIDADTSAILASTSVVYAANSCSYSTRTITGLSSYAKRLVKIRLTSSENAAYLINSESFAASGSDITFYTASDAFGGIPQILFDNFLNGKNTFTEGIYFSPVRNAPNLTSWDTFNATKADNGGTHSFFLRSSTSSFTVLSSTPAWTAATVGSVITISTGTYFQWKDSFTVTTATSNPVLQSATINWFEGSAADKAYATYFDDAVWWSVAFGAGQTTNNYIFKYDMLNDGWTLYNFGAAGFLVQSNNLYFGAVSDDKIFRFGNATSDNGTAINAYWKSKDFPHTDPWLESEYKQLDVLASRNTNETLTVGYTLNASTTPTTFSVALSSTTSTVIRHKKLLPPGKIGGLFNIQFSDTSTTSAWEVLGFRVVYSPLAYRPTQ